MKKSSNHSRLKVQYFVLGLHIFNILIKTNLFWDVSSIFVEHKIIVFFTVLMRPIA